MSTFASILSILCSALPVWVVAAVLATLTIFLIIIAIKVVAFVLDAIPFI